MREDLDRGEGTEHSRELRAPRSKEGSSGLDAAQ